MTEEKTEGGLGVVILALVILFGFGCLVGSIVEYNFELREQAHDRQAQEDITNAFIEALQRDNCLVSRLPIWQLKIENLSANKTVLVNTDNIRAGNITFMSSNGVDSIKIPDGNYPYLDAVKLMRKAVQKNRGGIE